jgi:hypothetical protein
MCYLPEKQLQQQRAGHVAQVVGYLPSRWEVLSSNASTPLPPKKKALKSYQDSEELWGQDWGGKKIPE